VHSNHIGIITVGMMAQMGSGLGGLGDLVGYADMGNLMKMMGGMGRRTGGRRHSWYEHFDMYTLYDTIYILNPVP